MERNDDRGSITVEAAFVMPIVIITVFALIYLAFYLHDICKIQAVTDIIIHKAGITVKHDADIVTGDVDYEHINDRGVFYILLGSTDADEKQIKDYLIQKLSKGLFLVEVGNINVDVGKFKISASVQADATVTLPGVQNLFQVFSKTVIAEEYPVHNPAETIRLIEVVLDTGSSIKGVDEAKEKLEKFFGSD